MKSELPCQNNRSHFIINTRNTMHGVFIFVPENEYSIKKKWEAKHFTNAIFAIAPYLIE